MAQLVYGEYDPIDKSKYFMSKEFIELLEQLNVTVSHYDGSTVFSGTPSSLEEIKKLVKEYEENKKEPGKDSVYMSQRTRYISEKDKSPSLDSILNEKYNDTSIEIKKRNKAKSLDIFKTEKEIEEMELEYDSLDEEILLLQKAIQKKKKAIDNINKYIEEKMDLILNKVITDPDEIESIQSEIDIKSKQANDLIEDLNFEKKHLETKSKRHEEIHCAIHDRRHAIEECKRLQREDEERRKKEQEEFEHLPESTKRRLGYY